MIDMLYLLRQTVVDEARTSEWRKCLQACVLFVPEMDVFITCFNFLTMYQVGVLQ